MKKNEVYEREWREWGKLRMKNESKYYKMRMRERIRRELKNENKGLGNENEKNEWEVCEWRIYLQ